MIRLSDLIDPTHINNCLLLEAGIKDFKRYITQSPQERAQEMLKKVRSSSRNYPVFIDAALKQMKDKSGKPVYDAIQSDYTKKTTEFGRKISDEWYNYSIGRGPKPTSNQHIQYIPKIQYFKDIKIFQQYPQLEKTVDDMILRHFGKYTDDYLDKNYKDMSGLMNAGRNYDQFNDVSWAYFKYIRDVKPGEWLIHFAKTEYADNIYEKGKFNHLVKDARYLGFTAPGAQKARYFEPPRGPDGFGFAYTAEFIKKENRVNFGMVDNSDRSIIMFTAQAIVTYHRMDETEEVVFWGPSARNLVYILRGAKHPYVVINNGIESVHVAQDVKGAIEWVEKNFEAKKDILINKI